MSLACKLTEHAVIYTDKFSDHNEQWTAKLKLHNSRIYMTATHIYVELCGRHIWTHMSFQSAHFLGGSKLGHCLSKLTTVQVDLQLWLPRQTLLL
jgi:hypothetical protein